MWQLFYKEYLFKTLAALLTAVGMENVLEVALVAADLLRQWLVRSSAALFAAVFQGKFLNSQAANFVSYC